MMTAAAAPESIFADASSRSEVSSDRASRRYYFYCYGQFFSNLGAKSKQGRCRKEVCPPQRCALLTVYNLTT